MFWIGVGWAKIRVSVMTMGMGTDTDDRASELREQFPLKAAIFSFARADDAKVMPPSHRRRGATTVFGQNRHHRSDTASSFS